MNQEELELKFQDICKAHGWKVELNQWIKTDTNGNTIYHRMYYSAVWYEDNDKYSKSFGFWDYISKKYSTNHETVEQYNILKF